MGKKTGAFDTTVIVFTKSLWPAQEDWPEFGYLLGARGCRALVTIDFEHDTPDLQNDMLKNIAFIEEQARLLG